MDHHKGKKRWNRKLILKGSYTVEAAILMGIILSVLTAVIEMGFYLHDRGFMQAASHEAACMASLHADDDRLSVSSYAEQLIAGKMIGCSRAASSAGSGKEKVTVTYRGELSVLRIAAIMFGSNQVTIGGKTEMTVRRPSALIQKMRGAAKIVERIRGD